MSGESFEWAIKKDVRNNPIVREVDLERHRHMWRSVAFSVLFVLVLVFVSWQQFTLQRYGYRMGATQEQLEREQSATRDLRLEIQALMAPQVIERKAIEQLHMVAPGPDDSAVIERVIEPPAPPSSVVAQR